MKNIKLIKVSALLVLALVFGFVFTGVNVAANTDCEYCATVDQVKVEQTLEDAYELLEAYGPAVVAAFKEKVNAFIASDDVQAALAYAAQTAEEIHAYVAGNAVVALAVLEEVVAYKAAQYEGQDCEYILNDVLACVEELKVALAILADAAAPYVALVVEAYEEVAANNFYVEDVLAYVENATNGVVTVANAVEVVRHAGHLLSTQVVYAQKQLAAYKDQLEDAANDAYNDLVGKIEAIEGSVAAYLADLAAEIEAIQVEVSAYLADLEAKVIAKVEETVAEVEAQVAAYVAAIEVAYEAATTGSYVTSADSYYVALGDSSAAGYVDQLAAQLYLVEGMYENLAVKGMRVEDLAYALAGVAGDAYYEANYAALAADYVAAIEAADIITLGFNNVDFVSAQLGELVPYALDWNRYFDAEVVAVVENLIAELDDELTCVLGDFKSTVVTLVTSYVYNYYGSLYYYPTVVEAIKAINPEAVVVSLSMYNPFQGLEVEANGTVVPVGDIIDQVIAVINQYHVLTGMNKEYTVSVSINGVETEYDVIVAENGLTTGVVELATQFLTNPDVFLPSEAGNAAIVEAVYGTLFHTCAHVAELEDGDCTTALACVLCGEILVPAAASHTEVVIPAVEATCAKAGSTEGSYCGVCGTVIVAPEATEKLDHVYDNQCDNECNNCGASNANLGDHEYDNNCDDTCNICGGIRRTLGHVFGDWIVTKEATKKEAGQEYRECVHCGEIEIRAIDKLPSNGAKTAIIVSSSAVGVGGVGFAGYWFLLRKRGFKLFK